MEQYSCVMMKMEQSQEPMTAETNRKETTRYLYGNGLICEQAGNQTLYHHYNQVGSTTELTDSNGLYYMRQRYYSPQLKRFLNQDIVTGDPKESQSLNRYCYVQGNPVSLTDPFGLSPLENPEKWLSFIHTILDVIGCIPGPVGVVANLNNGILYFLVDHDPLMGGLSMLAAVTAGASKLAVGVGKAAKTAQIIESFGHFISNAASFLINSQMLVDTALSMRDKYYENGQVLDSSFAGDAAQLALGALQMISSGKGAFTGSGKNLKKGLGKNADNTLDMNLQFFAGSKSGSKPKVHGNSKLSTKPQHGYEIYNTETGDVVKTGISGQKLNLNGTSPRANSQVNKLNKSTGTQLYDARIVETDMPNRLSALEWERENALRLWNEGNSMSLHKRPRPWEE